MQGTDVMIAIGGRWWSFPGSQIDLDSEFEWRGDGKLRLHDSIGNAQVPPLPRSLRPISDRRTSG